MRITNLILLTIAAIILAACSVKEITTGSGWVEDNGQTVLVNFIACSHAETKAEFGELSGNNYPVYWSDGDVIDIIIAGDTHSSKAISIEDDDNSQATFTFEIDKDVWEGYAENAEIVAVYPSGAYSTAAIAENSVDEDGDQIPFIIPCSQTPLAASVDKDVMIMSATTDKSELSLEFGHIVAYSKMTLTNLDEDIESVTITAADDILLATSASTIALDAQNVTPSVTAGSGSEAGTVSTYEATLWFTSLPSELSYFNIAANYTRGHASEKEILASSPLTLTGGHLTPFSVAMPEPGLILDRQSTTITMTNSRAVATETVIECDFTEQGWSNGEVVSSVELSDNQGNTITLTLEKEASQSSSPAYYTGSLRLYKNSTMTIESSQKIYSVEITTLSSYNGTATMYVTKNSSKSWTLCNYTSTSSYTQLRMSAIKITLAEPSADDDAEQSDSTTTDEGAVDTSAGSTAGTGSTSLGYDESGTSIDTSVPHWLELPAVYPNDDLAFYTHPMTIDGTVTRNYSFDWCPEEHVSYWVAYPLNSWLIGTGSRTNNWAYDPLVPESEQAYLKSAYNKDDDGTSYDRGHQLPSADRYNGTSNDETFYFTNMTPQISSFNQGIWAKLEDKVRTWALEEAVDTMYVVTGAYMKDYTVSTTDKKGTAMPVPVAYYKALLVKSTGSSAISGNVGTSSGGYYIGGAFYLEHKTYSSTAITTSYTLSIDELEAKVGIDFFVNLPDLIGTANAASVEAMKPSETTFWGL